MRNQKGNALFLILIAVALFAALSYAVTQSGRGSGSTTKETTLIATSQAISYMSQVRSAVQRLVLSGRCTESELRFWHASRANAGDTDHYGDGSNAQCELFDSAGGAVPYLERPSALASNGADEYMVLTHYGIYDVGQSNNSGAGSDLVMAVNVTRDACLAANDEFEITNPSGEPPSYTDNQTDNWKSPSDAPHNTFPTSWDGPTVVYAAGGWGWGGNFASNAPEINGKTEGCFSVVDTSGDIYYILYVTLLVR